MVCLERRYMVMIIGFVTMGALVWVLASCMAGESEAEKRRVISGSEHAVPMPDGAARGQTRQAA